MEIYICNMNLQEQINRIQSIMNIINENDYIQELLNDKPNIINTWTDYYGSDEKAKDELDGYISDFMHKYQRGGNLYRCVFINSLDEINLNELGHHWTVEDYYINDFIDHLWRHYGENKNMCVVIELNTEPHNITPPSDLKGNPAEKEVNIIDFNKTNINKLYEYKGKKLIDLNYETTRTNK